MPSAKETVAILSVASAVGVFFFFRRSSTKKDKQRFEWSCSCKKVSGYYIAGSYNSVRCYCNSCRTYGDWCKKQAGKATEEQGDGGIDIVQVYQRDFHLDKGAECIKVAKMNSKSSLCRFYASCCGSPICNTIPQLGFAGVVVFKDPTKGQFAPFRLLFQEEAPGPIESESEAASIPKFLWLLLCSLPWSGACKFLPYDMEPEYVNEEKKQN